MRFAIFIAVLASIVAVKAIPAGTYGDAEGEPKSKYLKATLTVSKEH